jgi:2'-5' RNA ligase
MYDQLSIFDELPLLQLPPLPAIAVAASLDAAPGVPHSLFFAVISDLADAARVHEHAGRVDLQFGVGGRALEAERLHVSLYAVGVYDGTRPEADIARWCRAAATVRSAPFEVVFDRAASFGGQGSPLVFSSSDDTGLLALHQAVGIALANAGEHVKLRRIAPHMTQSYRGKRIAETAIEPVRWRAQELVLIDSHVGAHRHEVLGRWPLRA